MAGSTDGDEDKKSKHKHHHKHHKKSKDQDNAAAPGSKVPAPDGAALPPFLPVVGFGKGGSTSQRENKGGPSLAGKAPPLAGVSNKSKNAGAAGGAAIDALTPAAASELTPEQQAAIQRMEITEHRLPLEKVFQMYSSDPKTGLLEANVPKIRERFGFNELTPPHVTPAWMKFLAIVFRGFSLFLLVGAFVCFLAYLIEYIEFGEETSNDNLWLGIVLVIVPVTSSTFTFYQEQKSSAIMDSFKKMVPDRATVLRDGVVRKIDTRELVPGDIVKVSKGDKVPGDILLVEGSEFKVDNSSLTGESEPVSKSNQCTHQSMLETANLAFFSSDAVEGSCTAIVVRTGDTTIVGHIAELATGTENLDTPMKRDITDLIRNITIKAVTIGCIFGVIALIIGYTVTNTLVFIIGIIIANVPEGILPTVAIALSITAMSMASKNCLVKNIEAVETLGSTSVICSDKTGTLTQNRMTTTHCWVNANLITINTSEQEYAKDFDKAAPGWKELAFAARLCSTASFEANQENLPVTQRKVLGDATEAGILKLCEAVEGNVEEMRLKNPRVAEIPFNSTNKFHLSIHEDPEGTNHLLLKGAPERVVQYCTSYLEDGVDKPMDAAFQAKFDEIYEKLGGLGERVIGFSDHTLPKNKFPKGFVFDTKPEKINFPMQENRFLGLLALVDPPKSTVPNAVMLCRSAGIRVIMVTGDHPLTAAAIARQVGIISPDSKTLRQVCAETNTTFATVDRSLAKARVIPGPELAAMQEDDIDETMRFFPEIVFARTSPEQKLKIVASFQRLGNTVAVTGDGVNDSPALKKADIGIAMGIMGSDVSKEAADMILLDDNFASIVSGVEEGRIIFDNLKKSVRYTLTSNIPELVPFLAFIAAGVPLALGVVTILCIDLGTNMLPSISYAYETAESDIMARKPRHPTKERLVTERMIFLSYGLSGMFQSFGAFLQYFIVMADHGFFPQHLVHQRKLWDDKQINDFQDSYHQDWSYPARKTLEYTCHAAYFLAIVEMQWFDLITSKTRITSVFSHGMGNMFLNFSLLFETSLALALLYVPGTEIALHTYAVGPEYWIVAPIYGLLMLLFDEIRKWEIRRNPEGFIGRTTLY